MGQCNRCKCKSTINNINNREKPFTTEKKVSGLDHILKNLKKREQLKNVWMQEQSPDNSNKATN